MRRRLSLIALGSMTALSACERTASIEAQTWRTLTSERQVRDTAPIDVQIQYGAGTLTIEPAVSPTLYRMTLRYDEEAFSPLAEYDQDRRVPRLGVQSPERGRRSIRGRDESTATIALTRAVPLNLNLDFGAGRADIQLGGVSLRRLSISTGASETTVVFDSPNPVLADRISIEAGAADLRVTGLANTRAERISFQGGVGATVLDFGGTWSRSTTASVQMGIGSVTLRLPRGQGVRINRSSFLTSFSTPGLERRGNSYYSANWDNAPHQLTIDLSAALGSVDVQWLNED
jgi:hypothetical protein